MRSSWRASGGPLAGGLDEVVEARLAALSSDQRRAVEAGAVVGRTFWGGAVAAITGLDVQEACRLLDEAVAAELLRGVRISTVAREAEYAFVHPLVREVVYARRRPGLHLAAAEWLDRALGGRADHDVLVAYHHAAADARRVDPASSASASRPRSASTSCGAGRRGHLPRLGRRRLHLPLARHERPGLRVRAVHVNHGLRGAESEEDARFCREVLGAEVIEIVALGRAS